MQKTHISLFLGNYLCIFVVARSSETYVKIWCASAQFQFHDYLAFLLFCTMEKDLLKVALRDSAIYLPDGLTHTVSTHITAPVLGITSELLKLGFAPNENLLHALNGVSPNLLVEILDTLNEVMGTNLNWAPLVKGWDTPTGETWADHLITMIANLWGEQAGFRGTRLPCGHLIPEGTFPLERYNGCPFCGEPFKTANFVFTGQGSKLRPLRLWTDDDLKRHYGDLLGSPVPLNATQADSLKILLRHFPLSATADIKMKETRMLVIDALVENGRDDEAGTLLSSPTDVMRYLWYRHTGYKQMVKPRTLIKKAERSHAHINPELDESQKAANDKKKELRLHYDRGWCRRVARWLNTMNLPAEKACEQMHPMREMWVRLIRALRLAEYARKPGFERLQTLLDVFYRQDYPVWQGQVDASKAHRDAATTLRLLQQRPGVFARNLFATMLWFGPDEPLRAFEQVLPNLPLRLLLTLGSLADNYFYGSQRMVRPVGSSGRLVDPNPLLRLYTEAQRTKMAAQVNDIYLRTMRQRWSTRQPNGKTIYIDPRLYDVPLSVGDRDATLQDMSCALQGTRFNVEGNAVRLFLQWGKGLPAQELDMDLSASILYDKKEVQCAYFNLSPRGAKHSGDIRKIPNQVGTAEYIELDLDVLRQYDARYVVFTCNAYSDGDLTPNLVVGWMNSKFPMTVDEETGVAYDPSTVQHMVRIGSNSDKGLVFGILDVANNCIIWLEMPFAGQNVLTLNNEGIVAFLHKLQAKPKVGDLLDIKAEAQHLARVDNPEEADEAYTYLWAQDPAAVTQLLLG